MEQENFYELFYSNLNEELENEKFVNSIRDLIEKNKLTKNNFIKLIQGEYHE